MGKKCSYANVAEVAAAQGFNVKERNGKYLFLAPDGETTVVAHGSESDHRAFKNTLSRLKRAGLDLTPLGKAHAHL